MENSKKVVVIIQARMGSTRLPGKVLLDLLGKTVLAHVIDRVKQAKSINEIVIATTTHNRDNCIVEEAKKNNVKFFRGSEDDVLSRYYGAAKENNADIVIRITSDCPLIDPNVIDDIVECYKQNNYDIVTNASSNLDMRTYPRGLDTEVFSFDILEQAFNEAKEKYQREHVTPYMYENSDKIYYYKNNEDFSELRWTLDTIEDFALIKKVYDNFYKEKHDFYMKDIVNFFMKHPELKMINAHVQQKKI